MNGMQPLVFEKGRFVFEEKSNNLQILATSVHKICDAGLFQRQKL